MAKLRNSLVLSLAIILFASIGMASPVKNSEQTEKTLEQQIFKQIVSMPYYGLFDNIGFEVDGETVTLSGKVYNASNKKSAARRVAKLDGVETVVNNIEILPPSSYDDRIRRRTVRQFARTGGIYRYLIGPSPSMRIIVDRGRLTLEGYVSGKGDIRLANIIAKGIPGVFSVTNNLQIADNKKY